ncbi:hypothetical protein Sste5346_006313 [Sporothrix stenoceras]|uniref:NAD(P)-binding domain-containing protein n=1 Tax=Sporothrix stenoceras TaxID=5173 RepID=A0ABR3YYL4_9PEZI
MHFLLLGATGRTGQLVVTELLTQGHTAVALVRNPDKLPPRKGLTVVKGSSLAKADIEMTITATSTPVDGCIFTLGTLRESESPFAKQVTPPRFLADSAGVASEVLLAHNVSRLVIMSTAGTGDSWPGLPLVFRAYMGWTNLKYVLADHNLMDVDVRATKTAWTLVRPIRLEFDTKKVTELDVLDSRGSGRLKMSDCAHIRAVARFLVKVAVEGIYIRETVVVRDA